MVNANNSTFPYFSVFSPFLCLFEPDESTVFIGTEGPSSQESIVVRRFDAE